VDINFFSTLVVYILTAMLPFIASNLHHQYIPDICQIEPLWQLKVQLNSGTLVWPPQCIHDCDVDLFTTYDDILHLQMDCFETLQIMHSDVTITTT